MAAVSVNTITAYNTLKTFNTVTGLALGTNTSFTTLAAGDHTLTPSSSGVYTRSVLLICSVTTGATVTIAAGNFWGSKSVDLGTLGANQLYAVVFEGANVGDVSAGAQAIDITVGVQTVGAAWIELP
jgi:hypothetical protein